MSDGEYYGMQTFDQSIARLYDRGLVDREVALDHASYAPALRLELERADRERDRPVAAPA
jgi:Tfp pilus assembly ATPase PilU